MKGTLKGLLLKDYYSLFKQSKIFVLFVFVFSLMPDWYMSGMAIIYGAMLPLTALAYDEQANWRSLAAMMPYSERSLVFSKYLLGYIGITLSSIFVFIVKIIVAVIKHETIGLEIPLAIFFALCIATLLLAFNLPFIFKFSVEKARIVLFAFTGATVFVVATFGKKLNTSLSDFFQSIEMLILFTLVFTVVLNCISSLISTAIYKSKEK